MKVSRGPLARVTPARRVEETEQAAPHHLCRCRRSPDRDANDQTPIYSHTERGSHAEAHGRAYSKATGSELTNSHVLRALLKAIEHAMPQLEHEAEQMDKLKRPKNDRANEAHRDEFERKLASHCCWDARSP